MSSAPTSIALLPLGSIEKHGPHLPLETDTVLAEELARRIASRWTGSPVHIAPAMTETASSFAASFPGTVSVPRPTERERLERVVADLLDNHARVALINLHIDPDHMGAVRDVIQTATVRTPGRVVFPDFTRRAAAERIGGEFATGACHAGEFETSLMLACAPDRVAPSYRSLPERNVNLARAILEGKRSFAELGLMQAYCGHPATASPAEGERLFEVLTELALEQASAVPARRA